MDSVLCRHRTNRRSAQGPGGVLDGGPLRLPPRGKDGGAEAECPAGGGGPGGDLSGGPGPRRTSTVMGEEDRVMADGEAVHGKGDRTGCAGMVRCPLPAIWPRAPIPPSLLRRLQHYLFHMPFP